MRRSSLPTAKLESALNAILPGDLRVRRAREAPLDFDVRRDARSRLYRYTATTRHDPCRRLYTHRLRGRPEIGPMRAAARLLLGSHDFTAFSAGRIAGSPRRRILRLSIASTGTDIVFRIEADGFLRHMARLIVGTLLRAGTGRIRVSEVKRILAERDRRRAGPAAPACGLALERVRY